MKNKGLRTISGMLAAAISLSAMSSFPIYADTSSIKYIYDNYEIDYSVVNEWADGQAIEIKILNTSEEAIANWALKYDAEGIISSLWNGIVYDSFETDYIIKGETWNYEIAPNESVVYGYTISGSNLSAPDNFEMCSQSVNITDGYAVDYAISSSWDDMVQGEIKITNTTDIPIEAWTLSFASNIEIDSLWGGRIINDSDNRYSISSESWNNLIYPNNSITIGFIGSNVAEETPLFYDYSLSKIIIDNTLSSSKLKGYVYSSGTMDLSDIKIDIFSSALKRTEEDLLIYENEYSFSTYTNSTGEYSFDKPTDNCLVQIDVNSLPDTFGVDKLSYFVDSDDEVEDFVISEIANVEIVDEETVIIYNAVGEELISDINIESDVRCLETYESDGAPTYKTYVYAEANGVSSTECYNLFPESTDLITQADELYQLGKITETEKIRMYLEAFITNNYGERESLTYIYDELINYYMCGEDEALVNEIYGYIYGSSKLRSSAPTEANYKKAGKKEVSTSDGRIKYTINYETNSSSPHYIDEATINRFTAYTREIINHYFVKYGFNLPMLLSGDDSYQIYFASGLDSNGFTRRYVKSSTKAPAGSLIVINYPPKINTDVDIKKTIAHEIFHSIQYTYTDQLGFSGNDKWFSEATATYAGLNYVNTYLSYAKSKANTYLSNVSLPFTDFTNDRNYGMFLFPQYISQRYGGLKTIKRIMEYVDNGYTVLDSMEKAVKEIDSGITYEELFAGFQSYNADPRKYTNSNNKYNEATRRHDNVGTANDVSVKSTAAVHLGFQAKTSSKKLTSTINITSGKFQNAIFRIVKFPGDGKASKLITSYIPSSTSITIVSSDFRKGTSNTDYPRITLVAANVASDYTSTYKFSLTRSDT